MRLFLLAVGFALLAAAPADAATLVNRAGAELHVFAMPGHANTIAVSGSPSGYTVTDAGDIVSPGSGCFQGADLRTVVCPVGVIGVVANGNDLDDSITVTSMASARIDGGSGNDVLNASQGGATLFGGPGTDRLRGGAGDDVLDGGTGPDVLDGGGGVDLGSYVLRGAGVTVTLDGLANDGEANEGDNALVENIAGGSANDRVVGSAGANRFEGNGGDDRLDGAGGNDRLWGADGDDDLFGGAGDDNLFGGDGNDTLFGGAGSDGLRGEAGDDFLAGPVDGDGDSMIGGLGHDECGGDHFDSITQCEGQ